VTTVVELSCPKCQHRFGDLDWHEDGAGSCRNCRTDFRAYRLPALTRGRDIARPKLVAVPEDSTCFFHVQNQAEKICDGCGRFVCAVCAIPNGHEFHCPSCLSHRINRTDAGVTERTIFPSIALTLALFPLLLYPLTILTAPISIGMVFMGWSRPGSLLRGPQRWKLVLAGIVSTIEIAAWLFLLAKVWLR